MRALCPDFAQVLTPCVCVCVCVYFLVYRFIQTTQTGPVLSRMLAWILSHSLVLKPLWRSLPSSCTWQILKGYGKVYDQEDSFMG